MRYRRRALLLWLLICGAALLVGLTVAVAQEEQEPAPTVVESRIDRVLLYSDRGLVIRAGAVRVPAGRSHVAFEGLPGKLHDATVAAAIRGSSARVAKIANIQVEPLYGTTFRSEEAQKAAEELKALEREMRALADRRAAVLGEAAFTSQIAIGTRPRGAPEEVRFLPLAPKAWADVLDYLSDSFQTVAERERGIAEEMDDLRAEITVAAAKARLLLSYKTEMTKRVILEIAAEEATDCDLEVSYILPDAAWFPRYDVRADLTQGRIEIVGYALARQESGEDWTDAELSFSAAEPSRAADLPKLASWRIAAMTPPVAAAKPEFAAQKQAQKEGSVQLDHPQRGRSRAELADKQAAELRRSLSGIEQTVGRQPADDAEVKMGERFAWDSSINIEGGDLSNAARVAGQVQTIERLNDWQIEARKKGAWREFYDTNRDLNLAIRGLNEEQQLQFGALIASNTLNLRIAERQLESEKLARGLIAPVRSSGGYDYRWQALRRETVPSDGALTKVVLCRHEFPAEFVYEIAAEKSKLAFLRTKLKNTTRSPFLAGPASVFLGADFVGESALDTCAPTESFTLGLGADEEIAVTRETQIQRETRGILITQYRFKTDVATSVKNGKGRAVTVVVYERIPYSWDDKLDVSEGEYDPKPTEISYLEKRPTLLRWEMDLAPGEKKNVNLGYWFQHGAELRAVATEDHSEKW